MYASGSRHAFALRRFSHRHFNDRRPHHTSSLATETFARFPRIVCFLTTLRVYATKLVRTTVRYDSFPVSDFRRCDAEAWKDMGKPVVRMPTQYNISVRFPKMFLKLVDLSASSPAALPAVMQVKDRNMLRSLSAACCALPLDTKITPVTQVLNA